MRYAYEAFDAAGKRVRGTVEAAGVHEATESVRRQGLFVATLAEAGRADADPAAAPQTVTGGAPGGPVRMGRGRALKHLAVFTRQLAVLVHSGTPLADALGALERQATDKPWRQVVAGLRLKVEEGMPLSEAMACYPQLFDAVARSLVAAGEAGGIFDTMLERLATMAKKQLHVRQAVNGALVYPALLIVLAVGVLNVMLLFVLPRFAELFASLDAPLPATTQFLMHCSALLRGYWWALLLGLAAVGFGGWHWFHSETGKRAVDTFAVRAPLLKNMVRPFAMARITRVLGTLLNGRVPMLDALALARQTAKNVHFVALVARAEEAVTRGGTVSGALAESDLVSPSLVEAVRSGEQSGQVAALLLNMADFMDEENEVVVKSLTSILEPVILIGLGVVVGFIAVSMFLPLFDLTSMAGGGGGAH
ncbi:MAG TPA: type II secretion system F family protein [Humisphaera sp.]